MSDRVEDLAANRGQILLRSLHSIVCTPREMVTGVLPKFLDREALGVLGAKPTMGGSCASVLLEDLTETREGEGGTSRVSREDTLEGVDGTEDPLVFTEMVLGDDSGYLASLFPTTEVCLGLLSLLCWWVIKGGTRRIGVDLDVLAFWGDTIEIDLTNTKEESLETVIALDKDSTDARGRT